MDALERLKEVDAIKRLTDRDPTLFSDDVDLRQPILQRLGWTDLATTAIGRIPLVVNLARTVAEEGATDVVLLGMGGSSLAAFVIAEIIGSAPGMPRLHVLDSTSPTMAQRLLETLERETTYFLVSSKSGTTIEPLSLYAIFRAWMEEAMERPQAGHHFIVITDPGTPLEKMRQKDFMRVALSAPPTVGGRFSALTVFGLTPAAMIGVDIETFTERALQMEQACRQPAEQNPGAQLAAWIVDSHAQGHDKLTLVMSARYRPFGLWVEQLVAESTGKAGTGIVPVIEHEPSLPAGFGPDRAVVVMRQASDGELERYASVVGAEHPLTEFVLQDPLDIGAEFVRWEYAIALVGKLLGINPFDEPNVSEAKRITTEVLQGKADVPPAIADLNGVWPTYAGALAGATPPATLGDALAPVVAAVRPGDYIALLAYLPYDDASFEPLRRASHHLSKALKTAVCVEMGPRYLHSTGQLHKGGPDTGVFLLITTREHANLAVPGSKFSLAQLYRAQAEGDLVALASAGRRVMRLDLPGDDSASLESVARAIGHAAG